jgi:hypothetical protein
MYNANFKARSCTNIHAVIQIDDIIDSIPRMEITFPIPQMTEVLRAMDGTLVARDWDTLVDPNAALLSPVSVSASGLPVPFWSGRGVVSNLQCTNWTSEDPGLSGSAGEATKVNGWMSLSSFTCNNFNQHFLCICW